MNGASTFTLLRGKPLLLGSSSSADNEYGSIVPFSRGSSCGFWLVKDRALRIGENDAVKPLVTQSRAHRRGYGSRERVTDWRGIGGKDKKDDVHVVTRPEKKEVIPNSSGFWEGYCKPWQWWELFPTDRLGPMNCFPTDPNVKWKFHSSVFCQVLKGKSLANGSCVCINSLAGALLHEPCKSFITRGTLAIKQP